MKATGIVRRIDDLGRVVIPKEIRRTLRIREGDPPQTTLGVMERLYEESGTVGRIHNVFKAGILLFPKSGRQKST